MSEPDFRPPAQQRQRVPSKSKWPWVVLLIAAVVAGGWWSRDHWMGDKPVVAPAQPAPPEAPPAAPVPQPEPEAAPATPEPESTAQPKHPLPENVEALAAEDDLALDRMISQWLDLRAQKFLALPGVAHHVVATIDNLPRGHAAPRLWPIYPVGGKMQIDSNGQALQIAPGNSARYDAVVDFVTGLDPAQVARWYGQAYPVLQKAYEDLGYPQQYFNDRLVAVIDHLLQTPELQEPLQLRLVEVQGDVAPQQPWLRYEFADPNVQALSAGQKIMLRLGSAHRHQLKQYLQALRAQVADKTVPQVGAVQ